MNRREIFKYLTVLPFVGILFKNEESKAQSIRERYPARDSLMFSDDITGSIIIKEEGKVELEYTFKNGLLVSVTTMGFLGTFKGNKL